MQDYTLSKLQTIALNEVAAMAESKNLKRPMISEDGIVLHVSNGVGAVLQVSFRAYSKNDILGDYSCGVSL